MSAIIYSKVYGEITMDQNNFFCFIRATVFFSV
jgi:hypothetical protein